MSRPALIAKLLRERHVARFIVAPDEFGKTNVALEYADTVFSFNHVFWIDAKSPCFLRDVDEGHMADVLLEADDQPFLVVFEDVPPLDPQRAEWLMDVMNALLDRDCEVLATCVPTCDVFEQLRDRVRIAAADLLLCDEELDALRLPSACVAEPASSIPSARRVAGLVWGGDAAAESFLDAALREELPSDLLLSLFVVLVLRQGRLRDLGSFCAFDDSQAEFLASNYPYLGIDVRRGCFSAAPFSIEALATAFSDRLDRIVRRSLQPSRDVFAARLADVLAKRRFLERACDVVRLLASSATRASWLSSWGEDLVEGACLLPACEVYRSLVDERGEIPPRVAASEAVRRALLGDGETACASARRVVSVASAPLADRATAALVLAECGDDDARARAADLLEGLVAAGRASAPTLSGDDASRQGAGGRETREARLAREEAIGWMAAAQVRIALSHSCAEAAEQWGAWRELGADGPLAMASASWVLREVAKGLPAEGADAAAIGRLGAAVRARVCDAREPLGLSIGLAGMAYERACEAGVWDLRELDAQTSSRLRRLEGAVWSQRTVCERLERDRSEARRLFAATHPDLIGSPAAGVSEVHAVTLDPPLTVNLFGGMEVFIGEDRVDERRFRRKKTQTLLTLLVLNRGRESSRDKLLSALWPRSNAEAARNNFYSIYSELRRALQTPSGTCPYLVRRQQGVRLDPSLLQSDVEEMEDVCRTLLFEQPGFGGWTHLYERIDRRFSEDLVPGEKDNEVIAGIRIDYRNRLVDALVAAARRLVAAGDVQEGLWFARAALQRDHTREDAYSVLMRAQIASGQRAAALDTYFSCRRFLSEELGLDPGPETVRLYRDIIETEG